MWVAQGQIGAGHGGTSVFAERGQDFLVEDETGVALVRYESAKVEEAIV